MGKITANISGTPPYAIVVRKSGEVTGNRCIGSCNEFPVTFTEANPGDSYYFIVTDGAGCVVDSRNIPNGVGSINCEQTDTDFDAELFQPQCSGSTIIQPRLILTNIVNATRYVVCYNSPNFDCDCNNSSGFINGTTVTIPLEQATGGQRLVVVRVYKDSSCTKYKQYYDNVGHVDCNCVLTTTVGTPTCAN